MVNDLKMETSEKMSYKIPQNYHPYLNKFFYSNQCDQCDQNNQCGKKGYNMDEIFLEFFNSKFQMSRSFIQISVINVIKTINQKKRF